MEINFSSFQQKYKFSNVWIKSKFFTHCTSQEAVNLLQKIITTFVNFSQQTVNHKNKLIN